MTDGGWRKVDPALIFQDYGPAYALHCPCGHDIYITSQERCSWCSREYRIYTVTEVREPDAPARLTVDEESVLFAMQHGMRLYAEGDGWFWLDVPGDVRSMRSVPQHIVTDLLTKQLIARGHGADTFDFTAAGMTALVAYHQASGVASHSPRQASSTTDEK